MKKILPLFSLLVGLTVWSNSAVGQCTPDPTYTAVGYYPNPLPDGCVGQPYNQVINFVFPNDTTIGGFTIPFTQFDLTSIANIPQGLIYACNANNCTYVPAPPAITRGCLLISGTPTLANAAPNDSVTINALAHTAAFNIPVVLKIGLKINAAPCGASSVESDLDSKINFAISPNPINGSTNVSFTLAKSQEVSVSVVDLNGRVMNEIQNGVMGSGYQQVNINSNLNLAAGVYYVKLNLPSSSYSKVVKIIKF